MQRVVCLIICCVYTAGTHYGVCCMWQGARVSPIMGASSSSSSSFPYECPASSPSMAPLLYGSYSQQLYDMIITMNLVSLSSRDIITIIVSYARHGEYMAMLTHGNGVASIHIWSPLASCAPLQLMIPFKLVDGHAFARVVADTLLIRYGTVTSPYLLQLRHVSSHIAAAAAAMSQSSSSSLSVRSSPITRVWHTLAAAVMASPVMYLGTPHDWTNEPCEAMHHIWGGTSIMIPSPPPSSCTSSSLASKQRNEHDGEQWLVVGGYDVTERHVSNHVHRYDLYHRIWLSCAS